METTMVNKKFFGNAFGKEVYEYTIQNAKITLSVMELGATVTALFVPDKNGKQADIAVGFQTADDYEKYTDNQGATIGRYANRIKCGTFTLDGVVYHIPCNDGNNMLHGNNEFRDTMWTLTQSGENFLRFSYTSPDGANGFPGEMKTTVTYTLEDNRLVIDYDAVSDKKTPICLTNHLYFNLTGDASKTVLGHALWVNADSFTPADSELIPTGEIVSVEGTSLDFRTPKLIGKDIAADAIVKVPGGIDHNFCLNAWDGTQKKAAVLTEPESGREMTVFTDLPGMQVYSGNFLTPLQGKGGVCFVKHGAVCLETQYYPDSPNHPNFPSCIFEAGKHFISRTIYAFSAK